MSSLYTNAVRAVVDGVSVLTARAEFASRGRILFIHGLWAGAWTFAHWVPWFAAQGYDSYAIDLRGHGQSPWQGALGAVSIQEYAHDTATMLKSLGPCTLVGHSMGGLVAGIVASRNPELVEKVIFVASGSPRGMLPTVGMLRKLPRYLPAVLASKAFLPSFADVRDLFFGRFDNLRAEELYQLLGLESGRAVRDILLQRTSIGGLACPSLVLGGHHDQATPLSLQCKIANRYGSRCAHVRCGHLMMLEGNWREPAQIILDWLEA